MPFFASQQGARPLAVPVSERPCEPMCMREGRLPGPMEGERPREPVNL